MPGSSRDAEFTELFTKQYAHLLGYIRTFIFDHNDAHDVFQQTALALWANFDRFEVGRDFGAWARGIAYNKVLDYLKKRGRDRARFSDAVMADLDELYTDRAKENLTARAVALADCLQELTARQRELVERCYGGAESVRQVATRLRRTPHSVYSSLRHIRTRLYKCIRRRLGGEEELGSA